MAPINTLILYLLLFWGTFYGLAYWLGRYIAYLYCGGDVRTSRFFIAERVCCVWLGIKKNDYRLSLSWLKLTVVSFLIGFVAMVLSEWLAFVRYGVGAVLAFRYLPWGQLFNITASYFTNTGCNSGYRAVLENFWGQIFILMPLGWLNAASWISLAVMLVESIFRKDHRTHSGNLHVYIVRSVIYLILPLTVTLSLLLFLTSDDCVDKSIPVASSLTTVNYVAYIRQHRLIERTSEATSATVFLDEHKDKMLSVNGSNSESDRELFKINAAKMNSINAVNRRRKLFNLIRNHSRVFKKASLSTKRTWQTKIAKWWRAVYQASDIVTANGRVPIIQETGSQKNLTTNQLLRLVVSLWSTLLLPAALTKLISAHTGKRSSGGTVFIIMLLLLNTKIVMIAVSELSQLGLLKTSAVFSQQYLQERILLWMQTASATATSLGSSVIDPNTMTVGSRLISAASLVLGNLIWGSNGIGLVTMLFYILFSAVWLEFMIAKHTRLSNKALKFSGVFLLMMVITVPSLVAMVFTLPELFASPSAPISLSKLIPTFYYYLSMLQGNGASLQLRYDGTVIWLGSIGMLIGHLLNGGVTIYLINRLMDQPSKNKQLNLLLDYPVRAMILLVFTIMLNLLTVAPVLMLGLA